MSTLSEPSTKDLSAKVVSEMGVRRPPANPPRHLSDMTAEIRKVGGREYQGSRRAADPEAEHTRPLDGKVLLPTARPAAPLVGEGPTRVVERPAPVPPVEPVPRSWLDWLAEGWRSVVASLRALVGGRP